MSEPNYDEMSAEELRQYFGNWSKAIRGLTTAGYSRSQIAHMTGKLYQHVKNVQDYKPKRPQNGTNKRQPNQGESNNGNT